jgi:WD40 repeat protein
LRAGSFVEMLRAIREEDSPRPSTRLSTTEELPTIAACRQVEPRKLRGLVRGELDWIVMKALEKDRNRRYEAATGLAMDIQHYLADEPVSACPPSTWYRFRKYARRYKIFLTTATTIVGILVAATATVAWKWRDAEHAGRQERTARLQAVKALDQAKKAEQRATAGHQRAVQAEREARLREAEALAGQAHGIRLSRRPGQRFEALAALGKAAAIGRGLGQPAGWFDRLRNEAIAALALPDIHVTETWPGFPQGTYAFDMSDDFAWYARTDAKGAGSVRRVDDDTELARLPELGEASEPAFGAGRVLAVRGVTSGRLHLWNLKDPVRPARLLEESRIGGCFFHPDGTRLAIAHFDGTIAVHDAFTGRCLHRLAAGQVVSGLQLALHPTEPLVATFSYYVPQLVELRDLRTGAVVASARCPWDEGCGHACWRPDGRALTVPSGEGGKIQQYSFDPARPALRPVRLIDGPDVGCATVVYHPAGDRFVTRGWSQSVQLFDEVSGRLLFATPSRVQSWLRFDRTGERLAGAHVGEHLDRIGLFSVAAGREYQSLVRPGGRHAKLPVVLSPAIHPGGRLVALAHPSGGDGDLARGMALFDLESGRVASYVRFPTLSGQVHAVFDGDGNLLTNHFDGLFRWPVRPDPARRGRWTVGPPERLPFRPSDCHIATSRDGRVIAQSTWVSGEMRGGGWFLQPGGPAPRCVEPGVKTGPCSVSPDGRWVAFTFKDPHVINVYETETGRRVWCGPANVGWGCPFSRDGRWFATAVDGGRLYHVGTWAPGPRLGGGEPWDTTAEIAVLGEPNVGYRLVRLADGHELACLEDPELSWGPATFTPDGTKLVVAAQDGARVWDLRGIRRELARLDLDWDAPPYPPAGEPGEEPFEVVVDHGTLAREAPDAVIDRCTRELALTPGRREAHLNRGQAYCQLRR